MIRKMVPRAGVALTTALILSACGGGGGNAANPNPQAASDNATALDYSYPLNQQTQVPTPAPVVLDFSNSISGTDVASSVSLHQVDGSGNIQSADVAVTSKSANNGKALILTPTTPLAPHTAYAVVINGSTVVKNRNIMFTTRAAQQGPESEQVSSDTMQLTSMFPNGSTDEPMMDFSTLRLDFSQPLDRSTVSYGNGPNDTVALIDSNNNVVPAHVLVDGPYLTIDPVKNLTPGQNYTLRFVSDAVKSTFGQAFYYTDSGQWHFTPKSSLAAGLSESQRPQPLVQKITQGGTSPLTGAGTNLIPVNATLLGDNNNIQQSGDVLGDLAFLPNYPNISPLSIRRGTLLKGASIHVNIGGKVYAGFDTGEVDVRFLTDASGYLMPNPYDSSPNAPKIVKLEMDVAISAANSTANGGVTQNITHLELIGTAQTDTKLGVVNINAVGVVQPEILGLERGYGTLSFQLQSYPDQTNAPTVAKDTTPPTLQSWTMDDGAGSTSNTTDKTNLFKPGDPIVLNFSEPLDPDSVKGKVTLYHNGTPMDINYYVDGAALVIKTPETTTVDGNSVIKKMMDFVNDNPGGDTNTYHLTIASGVTDLAGNATTSVIDQDLNTPGVATNKTVTSPGFFTNIDPIFKNLIVHSPIVLSVYPGFPCALSTAKRDLANGLEGSCAGGMPAVSDGTTDDNRPGDDSIPVMDMPANRPIIVQFSADMDPTSIVLGKTFMVQTVDSSGNVTGTVDGTLNVEPQQVTFTPNQPWVEGQLYQYTIASAGYTKDDVNTQPSTPDQGVIIGEINASSDYQCGVNAVCGSNGLPLQTQAIGRTVANYLGNTGNEADYAFIVDGPAFDAGGPDLVQYFKGASPSNNVVQILRTSPESDTNHNFFHDATNPYPQTTSLLKFARYDYDVQESSATDTPGDGSFPDFDPNGVATPENAAKILSRGMSQPQTPNLNVIGMSVGCNFQTIAPAPATLISDQMMECPKKKFSYLSSAIVAEVTDQVTDKGLKVLLWPSMVVGTSLDIFGAVQSAGFNVAKPGKTGPQFLRMRFDSSDSTVDGMNVRNQPIVGWITEKNGEPTLSADVDLYLDAPYTDRYAVQVPGGYSDNLQSYPVTMQLTGAIKFLDDGRMTIQQVNTNLVNIFLKFHNASIGTSDAGKYNGYADLFIPPNGSRLDYISQSIK